MPQRIGGYRTHWDVVGGNPITTPPPVRTNITVTGDSMVPAPFEPAIEIARNRNATRGESTHSYGASFDIAFMDRPNEKANCSRPTREIQKLLVKYQKAGRILIIPEGGCMHITLIR